LVRHVLSLCRSAFYHATDPVPYSHHRAGRAPPERSRPWPGGQGSDGRNHYARGPFPIRYPDVNAA